MRKGIYRIHYGFKKYQEPVHKPPEPSLSVEIGYLITPTAQLKGILEIGYAYNANVPGYSPIVGCGTKNDTAYFRFWLQDKNRNVSDTISSENIVLLK